MLARPGYTPLEIAGSLSRLPAALDETALRATALETRPEIRRLQLELDCLDSERRQAGLTNVPDLEVGFSSHRVEGEPRTWDVTVSAAVPLFWWQPRKGAIADADARRRAAGHDLRMLREAVALEVEQAYLNVVTTRAQIDAFEADILAPANRVYEMLLFSFQQGELGGIELIRRAPDVVPGAAGLRRCSV